MTQTRLPDCKPPRRDDSVSSASSHPELLVGEIAMRPRVHVPLPPKDQAVVSTWSRRMLTVCAFVVAGLLVHSLINQSSETIAQDRTERRALNPACMQWHEAAGDAVSRLARSTKDADLRQLNDAIFRMRRARRNCAEGWFMLACQDYYAVARNMPGYATPQELAYACRPSAEWTKSGQSSTGHP